MAVPTTDLYANYREEVGAQGPLGSDGLQLIETWQDQTANALHLTAATTLRPFKRPGEPGVCFNYAPAAASGTNDYLTFPTISLGTRAFGAFFVLENYNCKPADASAVSITNQFLFRLGADLFNVYIGPNSSSTNQAAQIKLYPGGGAQLNTGLYLPSSKCCFGVVGTASAVNLYLNGVVYGPLSAATNATATGGTIGGAASSASMWGHIHEIAFYNAALTTQYTGEIIAEMMDRHGIVTNKNSVVVFDGDSITTGYNTTGLRSWSHCLMRDGTLSNVHWANVGIPSARLSNASGADDLTANFAGRVTTPYASLGHSRRILVIMAGTNDIAIGSASGATTLTRLGTYITNARTAGWNKIVAATMLPRSGVESDRATYNTGIRALLTAGTIDGLIDFDVDSRIGAAGANADSAFFGDGTHPTERGQQIMADVARPVIWRMLNDLGQSNVIQISGDSTAADNLESQFDGTGLTGNTYPATQLAVASIAAAPSAATVADAVWDEARSGHVAAGSFGEHVLATTSTGSEIAGASIFTGITSLAQWLGLIAGKQVGNSTARTELRATGAGSGGFDETTDSLQAAADATSGAGSATLANQQLILAKVNPARIVANTGLTAENKTIYADADYSSSDTGRPLSWSVADVDLTAGTVAFYYMLTSAYEAGTGTWTSLGTGSVTAYSSGLNTVKVSLLEADVDDLTVVSPPADKFSYTYKVEVTVSGRVRRSVLGGLNVVR